MTHITRPDAQAKPMTMIIIHPPLVDVRLGHVHPVLMAQAYQLCVQHFCFHTISKPGC
jgi:hypothetical protein